MFLITLKKKSKKVLTYLKKNGIINRLALWVKIQADKLIQEVEENESTTFSKTNLRKVQDYKKKRQGNGYL